VERRSFFERYRTLLVGGVVVAIAAVVIGLVVTQTTQAAYTCTIQWEPTPTASPAADASPRLGYPQDNMGNSHAVQRPQRYTFCPPASGNHYNQPGTLGPIVPRVYGPSDNVGPPNWIHNLEHGAIVILYRGDGPGATPEGQQAFRTFFESFPPSPICRKAAGQLSPVIARFDDMKWPFAALVWGRVLPMETWDPALALKFYATESERLDADGAFIAPPEPQCAAPSPSAEPSGSAAPGESTTPSSGAPESPAASSGSAGASESTAPGGSVEPSPAAS
jgi:hypothetical protein